MWDSVAWAQGTSGSAGAGGGLLSLVPFVLIFVIFYFMLILPQQKRQKQAKTMIAMTTSPTVRSAQKLNDAGASVDMVYLQPPDVSDALLRSRLRRSPAAGLPHILIQRKVIHSAGQ